MAFFGHKALHGAGQVEVEARPTLGRERGFAGQFAPQVGDEHTLLDAVGDRPAAVGGGQVEAVGHRAAPVGPGVDAGQAVVNAHEAADVARVAVGVPAGGVDDHQRFLEVVVAVEQPEEDQGVVGDHVAVAAVVVVAVAFRDLVAGLAPVGVLGVPLAQVADQAVNQRIGGDEAAGRVEQPVEIGLDKGLGFHGRHHLGRQDGFAVVADPPGLAARSAASSGSPGQTMAQPSMKICAPICSATTSPLRAIEPLRGAGMPCFRRR